MITPAYVALMARYNAWQNRQLIDIVRVMDEAALDKDHGAFFGSIRATLNHVLWGDTLWMSRFSTEIIAPSIPASEHKDFTADGSEWCAARAEMDAAMTSWARDLAEPDLQGDLSWYSGMTQQELSRPRALCIAHLFNHQTHHRGQVHAMLTAAGQDAPVTDIVFMPEDA